MEFGLCEKLLIVASLFFSGVSFYDMENGWLVGFRDPNRDTKMAARLQIHAAGAEVVALLMSIGHTLCETTNWFWRLNCQRWPVSVEKLLGGSTLLKVCGCCLFLWKVGASSPCLILSAFSIVVSMVAALILLAKDSLTPD